MKIRGDYPHTEAQDPAAPSQGDPFLSLQVCRVGRKVGGGGGQTTQKRLREEQEKTLRLSRLSGRLASSRQKGGFTAL